MLSLLLSALAAGFAGAQSGPTMLVGTYDSPKSEGIYLYDFNNSTGETSLLSHVKSSNPSFLAVSPDNKFVYAVNENAPGQVSAFSFDKKKKTLTFIDSQSSKGNHPCYITTDKSGKWVIAGNYSSGSLALFPVQKGKLKPAVQVITHTGSGPDTTRQKSPHVHATIFKKNTNELYVPDLGTDKVYVYGFNPDRAQIFRPKIKQIDSRPGSGPRHLDFGKDGKSIYILHELTGSVTMVRDSGLMRFNVVQEISALPVYYKGAAGSADIHVSPDGKFLYCSNRGSSNTIAVFSIDAGTGLLTAIGHQSTQGVKPRNFSIDPSGNFLLVANQDSDEIVIFKRDLKSGLLSDTGKRIAVGKPVCIKWIQ
ncbi:MAG: lactonase family protein [Chitinophagaceae bacterium]|nr:lactonase family protein [Chitinophagaceae bacterium]